MTNKVINRVPVVESLDGDELVYGTKGGAPRYLPIGLISDEVFSKAAGAADSATAAMIALESIVNVEEAVKALLEETKTITDAARVASVQSDRNQRRSAAVGQVVDFQADRMDDLLKQVQALTLQAQLAKEYADQAAKSANSKFNYEVKTFDFDAVGDQVEFDLPAGWYPLAVFTEGRARRQGKNKDWVVQVYSSVEHIVFMVPPGDEAWVSIVAGRK